MVSKTKRSRETSEYPTGPVDLHSDLELDDGTPVTYLAYDPGDNIIKVRIPYGAATRRDNLGDEGPSGWWYSAHDGVHLGGDAIVYKVLRNRLPAEDSPETIASTLAERGSRYGSFQDNSSYAQDIKAIYRGSVSWDGLADDQREALDMVASKISRILSGDPHYRDNWHDMVGYLKLVDDRMTADGL